MDMRLALVPIPVVDVDRATTFYVDNVGFSVDHDVSPADDVRVVQLTPSGSACSIVLAHGLPGLSAAPGSVRGLHLVVDDIDATRKALVDRGIAIDEVADLGGGVRVDHGRRKVGDHVHRLRTRRARLNRRTPPTTAGSSRDARTW